MLEYDNSISFKKYGVVYILINYDKELLLRTIDKHNVGKEYEYKGGLTKKELFSEAREQQISGWPNDWQLKEDYKVLEA